MCLTNCIKCGEILNNGHKGKFIDHDLIIISNHCKICNYYYCIPDPEIYKTVETSIKCPITGLNVFLITAKAGVMLWANKNCKECNNQSKCNISEIKNEFI